ncbi:MAG: hypothetical protein IK130_07305 [Oscillospiraceae bacterium]|nr:hypothetical protein [Oscillospiraceae bacterium]
MKTTLILKAAALACAAVMVPVSNVSAASGTAAEAENISLRHAVVTCTETEDGKVYGVTFEDVPENGSEGAVKVILNGEEVEIEENSGTITFDDEGNTVCVYVSGDPEAFSDEDIIFDGAQVFDDEENWEDIVLTEEEQQAIDALEQQLDSLYASLPELTEGNEAAYKEAYAAHEADFAAIHEKINDIYSHAAGFDIEDPDALCCYCWSVSEDEDGNVTAKAYKGQIDFEAEDDTFCEEIIAEDEAI